MSSDESSSSFLQILIHETAAIGAQLGVFFVGMAISIAIGMGLAKVFDSLGGLLFSTIIAAAGLLISAGYSQRVYDTLIMRLTDQNPK